MRQYNNILDLAFYVVLGGCCLSLVASAPAPEAGNSGSGASQASNSPQFLYMKWLHDRIKDQKMNMESVVELKDEQTSGTLIATSFEASGDISGTGWNTSFHNGNHFTLNFIIPNPGDSIGIHETDLWLFPDPSQLRNNSVTDLTLLVVVTLAHANKPRREVMNYSWRMDSNCLRLNLTSLSKKVVNNLQKRGLEKSNITVSIEVVTARDPEPILVTEYFSDMDLQEGCSALQLRSSNAPFLVMKYYDENHLTDLPLSDTELTTPPPSRLRKRQSSSEPVDTSIPSPTTSTSSNSWKGCSVVPLKVNLTKVIGDFIIQPKEMYVNDCSGSCNTGRNPDSFTLHSRIKEQHKLVEGVDNLQRSETCCSPSSYDQAKMLIRKDNYITIVSFPDIIVTGCQCK